MAMHLHSGIGNRLGSRPNQRRRRRKGLMSEINVTPFVDVMLVLLIIFMVTAPLMTSGVEVDLPEASTEPMSSQDEPLVISLNKRGTLFLQETEIKLPELGPKLQAILKQKPDTRIFIRADRSIDYGRVMEVMGSLHESGLYKVGLMTADPTPE